MAIFRRMRASNRRKLQLEPRRCDPSVNASVHPLPVDRLQQFKSSFSLVAGD